MAAILAGFIETNLESKKPDNSAAKAHDRAIYWAQTISGNWPGEPPQSINKNRGETLFALMAAISINLATLGALGAGLLKLTRLERGMDTRDMIAWHSILLKQQLEDTFTEILGKSHNAVVKDAVSKSFARASDELKEYAIIIGKTPEGKEKYIKQADDLKL